MEYLKVIKEFLPKVFNSIKKEILSEPEILNFVESKEKLEELIEKQSSLLMDYFVNFPNASEVNMSKIESFYKSINIPYIVIIKNIDMLKNKLLERIAFEKELNNKEFLFEISSYIDNLRNKIAYIYLKKDIHKLRDINAKTFKKYLLYKSNLDFIERLIEAIENNDLSKFPLEKADECEFYNYLHYPESLMVCMDANLCSYIEDLHKVIHKISNSMYVFLLKNRITDAYSAFRELLENVLKLSKTLAELYFIAFSDAEMSFFKLVEYLFETREDKYIFIIDIQNLKNLNKIYSEKKINLLLKNIENKLNEFTYPRRKNLLFVRGITANFYMLAFDLQKEKVEELSFKIKEIIESESVNDDLVLKPSIGVLKIDKNFTVSKDELIKVLLQIKSLAKKEENSVKLIVNEREQEKILNWLNKKYQDIKFIKRKLLNKEIEVVFQPIFETRANKIYSLEALARIVNGNGSLIPAGVFIDLIYQYDLIFDLDIAVLEKILEKKNMLKSITNTIFLNISPQTLIRKEFFNFWKEFVNNMRDIEIVIEFTEQKIIEDMEIIKKLKSDNTLISFAIDDFGTGYSSLKTVIDMVKNNLLHILKIDGSLIKEITKDSFSEKIVRTISLMTENLSIDAVAEFVENQEILDKLKNLNIKYCQGFYLSEPKELEDILIKVLNG